MFEGEEREGTYGILSSVLAWVCNCKSAQMQLTKASGVQDVLVEENDTRT